METIVSKLTNYNTRLESLEGYQDKQNGHIKEIRDDMKALKRWLMCSMFSVILMLASLLIKVWS